MASPAPELALGLDAEARPVVLLEQGPATTPADLLRLAPDITEYPAELATALNHLAQGTEFQVITDPAKYEAAYRARLAQEDPSQPVEAGVIRLCDYGVPDFSQITKPSVSAGTLSFHVIRTYFGLPYHVSVTDLIDPPTYTPMPLARAV
jgi:hypothetical protein